VPYIAAGPPSVEGPSVALERDIGPSPYSRSLQYPQLRVQRHTPAPLRDLQEG